MVRKDDFVQEDFSIALRPVHVVEQDPVADGGDGVAGEEYRVERIGKKHMLVKRLSRSAGERGFR